MLSLPTCVSLRYGRPHSRSAAFLGSMESAICVRLPRETTNPHHLSGLTRQRLCHKTPTSAPYRLEHRSITMLTYPSPFPRTALNTWRFRNINLIPITYALRPRLRTRLTLSGISLLEETLGLRRPGFSPGFSLLMSA